MKLLNMIPKALRLIVRRPHDAMLALRISVCVCCFAAAAKLLPLPHALSLISTRVRPKATNNNATQQQLVRIIDALLKTNLLFFEPVCWKRTAVLHRYLALNGISTKIVFGVRRENAGELHGHSWLEEDGRPILESAPPDYTVTYTFPSTDSFDLKLAVLRD